MLWDHAAALPGRTGDFIRRARFCRMLTLSYMSVSQRIPERIVEKAVKGMLPRGRLGNNLFRHLKVCCRFA